MEVTENSNEKIVWSALEYEHKERSRDWFWALGVIVFASSAAALIYGNYFFALLIIMSGALLGFYAVKIPESITYEINEKGMRIKDQTYLFSNIKSFYIQIEPKMLLFMKTERVFMPIISIPVDEEIAENIHGVFMANEIPEEEMREHPSEKIMDTLGF